MERKILVATTNVRKGGEMIEILQMANLGVEIVTLANFPDAPPVDEIGETFMANAHLKAEAAIDYTGLLSLSDDGGLVIDALAGAPGVKSHRFLGENTPFAEKMDKILEMLRDVPDEQRTCRFQCAVVIAVPDGRRFECLGTCEGRIAHARCGDFGFGYDPIFFLPELGKHMAELPSEQKHKISHRGKAMACATQILRGVFGS